ncbi:pimeloyl-ACP methyl ester carboxylesterase [Crossiella equi]|uniref:Pimeloyl-ACP methyl ester carboxylesterase n=1 Tax=Crossiella equi TaxID=130796 RepID=A0ABS5ALW0_9PSEU|nr:alpha/beta hydrolase [Crossiella equi]MBP2477545.1 pimeloyl-ACP methyl ester carboxylesterase [Crossiella equi]
MLSRRTFTKLAATTATLAGMGTPAATAGTGAASTRPVSGLGPLRHVRTELLDIAYHESGPADGPVVLLGHGWPYSPHAFTDVVPALVHRGHRVLTPYLRGHGETRFRAVSTSRSGQQAAMGADWLAFLDALRVDRALFAGYDWGGRGLCVAAALWPERCAGLVSVNSYLVQDLSAATRPGKPSVESAQWYFYYFLTERGRNGLTENAKELAREVWTRNSPTWRFTEADLNRAAGLWTNPDYVPVVLHSYRHRLLAAEGDPRYADLEARLARLPRITVPAVTLDGLDDGNFPATDGTASAKYFTGPRVHHQVAGAGHNLPQERPKAFVNAVLQVARLR